MRVYVFENTSLDPMKSIHGFTPGHPLRLAYASSQDRAGRTNETVAEEMFGLLNRDDRPNGKVAPSMSVGDVVTIEDEDGPCSLAVRGVGFDSLVDALVPTADAIVRLAEDLDQAAKTRLIVRPANPAAENEAVIA